MDFGNKEYFYAKLNRVSDVGFWQEIVPNTIIGKEDGQNKLYLTSGIYVVLFGIQVVSEVLQDVSMGIFCRDEFVPDMIVMGTSVPNGIINLAGNGIILLEKDGNLVVRNMTKGEIDCYEMMLSVCKI